jgi:hypothetical protein
MLAVALQQIEPKLTCGVTNRQEMLQVFQNKALILREQLGTSLEDLRTGGILVDMMLNESTRNIDIACKLAFSTSISEDLS